MALVEKIEKFGNYVLGINDLRALESPNKVDTRARYFMNMFVKTAIINPMQMVSVIHLDPVLSAKEYDLAVALCLVLASAESIRYGFHSLTNYPNIAILEDVDHER